MWYPEKIIEGQTNIHLDLTQLDLEVFIPNIDTEESIFPYARKYGLGTSDSSTIMGVNPFPKEIKTINGKKQALIEEKARDYLTPEEQEVGDLANVRKGNDLEPLIIVKHSEYMDRPVLKPSDMYYHRDYPWLKFNFDGVLDQDEEGQYTPDEIKVLTMYGEKYYDLDKAYFNEKEGFKEIPENFSQSTTNSIQTKAAQYGIPPYYYTQLQTQIFAFNAPYGYLTIMRDKEWLIYSYFVWRDEKMINDWLIESNKIWNKVVEERQWVSIPEVDALITGREGIV